MKLHTLRIRKGHSNVIDTSQIVARRLLHRTYFATNVSRVDGSRTFRSGLPSGLLWQVNIEPKLKLGSHVDRAQVVHWSVVHQYNAKPETVQRIH